MTLFSSQQPEQQKYIRESNRSCQRQPTVFSHIADADIKRVPRGEPMSGKQRNPLIIVDAFSTHSEMRIQ
jgi:hypothetical protein